MKKHFLSVILLLLVLFGSGCVLGPTVNYIYAQCGDDPRLIWGGIAVMGHVPGIAAVSLCR